VLTHPDYPIAPAPLTAVRLTDSFWRPRLETNRGVTLPFVFDQCEKSGRIANFAIAGGLRPKPAGWLDNRGEAYHARDSDVFKVVEGAAYALAQTADPALDAYLDNLIAMIAAAQEPDGYLYTSRTIDSTAMRPDVEGASRWSYLRRSHELYNVGHLYEAAAAHYLATGKRALLDVALKNADLVDGVFGPDRKRDVPGHQEIELALVKLYRVTGEPRYLQLAQFFLDERGHARGRTLHMNPGSPAHQQDHLPVIEQAAAVGHAVRGPYMYAGMADVAALTGEPRYITALDRIWENVVGRKLYLTGGLGARHKGESFGDDYELPNAEAYAETCAAIANMLWNQRMFQLRGDARYVDVLELSLYNGFLSGVSLSGQEFFYANPLASDGKFAFNKGSATREAWFECPCCPTNTVRFLASLPGYVYATGADALYVNLFVAGQVEAQVGGQRVRLRQQTAYPWGGEVRLAVEPDAAAEFTLAVRIPGWARHQPVPSDLYRFLDASDERPQLAVNGEPVTPQIERGYAVLRRVWRAGDVVDLTLPFAVRRVICHEAAAANRGRVALMRGPLVYCVEGADNGGSVAHIAVADDTGLTAEPRPDLLGGVTVIRAAGAQPFTAIPYYAWANRGAGEMAVWAKRA
jgi:hypothetical protein